MDKAKRLDNGEWVEGVLFKWYVSKTDTFSCYILPFSKSSECDDLTNRYVLPFANTPTCGELINLLVEVDENTHCIKSPFKDKNGNDLWTGDIISNRWCFISDVSVISFGEYKSADMSSEYRCGHYGYFMKHSPKVARTGTRNDILFYVDKCEKIGNCYDNPELLEGWKENEQ